jgi:uncharacterized protein YtpQ (UPF0354 family)
MDALSRAGDDRMSTYDKAEFRLLLMKDGKEAGVLHLRNLFTEYCHASKEDRPAWLTRTCKGLLTRMEIPDDFEDAKPDLLPTVRTRSMLEVLRLDSQINGDKPKELVWIPLTDHLVICFVYDLPHSMQFVTEDDLSTWGVSAYEILEVAGRNLAEREFAMLSLDEHFFIFENGDAYDAARLLLMDAIRRLGLVGQPVAMPITRDCLMITGTEDVAGLAIMASLAEEKSDEARPLCPIPMRLDGENWETWLPPTEHPEFDKFRMLDLKYSYGEYDEQKKRLEKRHEQTGEDAFVASFSAVERDALVLSYCVWSKSVVTWLPRTQFVGLYDPETKECRFVRWERLEQTIGQRMIPLDCYPPRWSVDDFPSEAEIAQMGPENWSDDHA